MAAKLYYTYIALSRVFAEIFQKVFLYTAPTIPKLGVLLRCIAWDKSRAILNCRLFAFALKMIFNLILKLNLKTVFNSKMVLNLILNLKMIYVSRDALARRRRNIITKAHLWAENYNTAIQFCQELF